MVATYAVLIPSPLRSYTRGADRISVSVPTLAPASPPLAAILAAMDSAWPGIRFRMVDEQGKLRPHIRIFVGREPVRDLSTPVPVGTEVMVVAALSGG